MACRMVCIISLLIFEVQIARSQQSGVTLAPLLQRSDAELRKYVEQYLDDKSSLWHRDRDGKKTVDIGQLVSLTRTKPWVLPMLEDRLDGWLKAPETNKHLIQPISYAIVEEGTQRGLDAIVRLFSGRAEEPTLVKLALLSGFDYAFHNHYTLWYHALDSSDIVVRETAENILGEMATDRTDHRLRQWADALVDRYGHVPTELELLTDPLVMVRLAWRHDRVRASENQRKLMMLAEDADRKRTGRVVQK